MPGKKLVFLFIGFLLALSATAQDRSTSATLNIRGIAELDMKPLSGATATLYEGSNQVSSDRTGVDGRFSFRLDANKKYTIEVSKDGLVSKRISFDTEMPEEEKGQWTNEFSIGLVKFCDGVDYSILNEPVDIIEFDPKRREFLSNRDYVTSMRPKLERVLSSYETCLLNKYETLVKKADQLVSQKNYEEAIANYEAALDVYPDEDYPRKKIAEIQALVRKDQLQDQAFEKAVSEADALFEQQRYEEALAAYKRASDIKPEDAQARQRMTEAEKAFTAQQDALKEQRAQDDAYNQALVKAGVAYTQKDYKTAETLYQRASEIKPDQDLPRSRLTEIQTILEKKAAEEAKARETDEAYNNAVAKAESLQQNKEYDAAKEQFAIALSIKPAEAYPKSKMAEIDRAVEAEARAEENARKLALENEYKAMLKEADDLFAAKDFGGAEAAYEKAQAFMPDDPYPRQRINAIESAINAEQAAQAKAVEDGYKAAIGAANTAITQKNYDAARTNLQKALTYKPGDPYATGRISDVDFMVAEEKVAAEKQQMEQEEYGRFVAEGDGYFANKDYDQATAQYNLAMQVRPGDSYVRQKLNEIGVIQSAEVAARKKQQEEEYSGWMAAGAEAMVAKDYAEARDAYEKALAVKPGDASAESKRNAAERSMLEARNLEVAEAAKKEQYEKTLASGDEMLAQQDYARAQQAYLEASGIFPAEAYPRQKLDEIRSLLGNQAKALQEKQAVDNAYQTALEGADKYFRARDYVNARNEYNRAIQLKPDESYPKDMIAELEGLIEAQEKSKAEAQQRSDTYASAINTANDLFGRKEYAEARAQYELALKQVPDDKYAANQISQIDHLLAEQERMANEEQEKFQKYNAFIDSGDKAFDAGYYDLSMDQYKQALRIDPGSSYARQRIERIEEINRILSDSARKIILTVEGGQASLSGSSPAELSFATNHEWDRYFEDLKKAYPEGITLEIYREEYKETLRYIVIRNDVAQEFRKIRFLTFGGTEYSVNGKPITQLYFDSQTRQREGEQYKEIVMQ